MNVIIANEQQAQIATLDIDVIKSITGTYGANEIVEMFKNFFYSKMVLDVTAIKGYTDVKMFKILAEGLDPDKIVFFIPEGNSICTPNFLAQLVTLGIYNFTTNLEGVKYLLKKSNTYKDVAHIQQMGGGGLPPSPIPQDPNALNETGAVQVHVPKNDIQTVQAPQGIMNRTIRLGVKSVSEHAGASSLIYMMKKELTSVFGENKVVAIEVNKNEFQFFNDQAMVSSNTNDLRGVVGRYNGMSVILIDLNDYEDNTICDDVLYLIESSTLKLNKLIRKNSKIFANLKNQKVILNQSLLTTKEVSELEYEAGIKFFYTLPPLNDRKKNEAITGLLSKLGLVQVTTSSSKIFGLFRR
ncbi:MAG: hypothetical protein Q4F33_02815 [Mycoplasmatota bacterium]|nr:hypothetical protein [Mycoplasmatota bacterium]